MGSQNGGDNIVHDELAIRNLIARIAHLTDGGDLADYGSLLADDAVWDMPGVPAVRGREEIVAASAARRASGSTGPGADTRHVVSTVSVELDGDSATSEAYWQFYGQTRSSPVVQAMGKYTDTFRRTPEGWKFAHRVSVLG